MSLLIMNLLIRKSLHVPAKNEFIQQNQLMVRSLNSDGSPGKANEARPERRDVEAADE